MSQNFYNKVAKKFGGYTTLADHPIKEYPDENPEAVFKDKLIKISGKNKIALDIGCADGRFTLSISSFFKTIHGIDNSKEMLKAAERNKDKQKIKNVIFSFQDASKTKFENDFFDVAYNRRGPSFFKEYSRVLKKGGYYFEIDIGKKDTMDLKKTFGRGQNFGEWHESRLEINKKDLIANGFKVQYAKDFFYDEFFASEENLDIFLQGVPIFEDYDSKKDEEKLKTYIKKFSSSKGIKLPRHRVVILAQKK